MKAADRLGAGTAFAAARNPRNLAKAQASGDIPMYDLVTLPLDDVRPTPLNPRRNFGSSDELLTLGQGLAETQLQPCVAVPAGAYLRLWPEHAEQVGSVGHVLINGERRWRAAQEAGMEKLDFTLRSDLAVVHDGDTQAARAKLLDAVLKENIDRKNFDPIEEARGVAALVATYGDGVRAGQLLNRGKAWVSQRLTLLALPDSLQDEVGSGRISIDDGRWMGARAKKDPDLTAEVLLELLHEHQDEQRRAALAKPAGAPAPAERFTAVNPPSGTVHPDGSAVPAQGVDADASLAPSPSASPSRFTAVNPEVPEIVPSAPAETGAAETAAAGERGAASPGSMADEAGGPQDEAPASASAPVPAQAERSVAFGRTATSGDAAPVIVLRSASPEDIVKALVWELTPGNLARVTQLLQERRAAGTAVG